MLKSYRSVKKDLEKVKVELDKMRLSVVVRLSMRGGKPKSILCLPWFPPVSHPAWQQSFL